jgi:hypothetical protein
MREWLGATRRAVASPRGPCRACRPGSIEDPSQGVVVHARETANNTVTTTAPRATLCLCPACAVRLNWLCCGGSACFVRRLSRSCFGVQADGLWVARCTSSEFRKWVCWGEVPAGSARRQVLSQNTRSSSEPRCRSGVLDPIVCPVSSSRPPDCIHAACSGPLGQSLQCIA